MLAAMSARKMRRARSRALAAGTAVSLVAVVAPSAASADSVVINTANSGPGSLRQALVDSNAEDDPDTITFAPNVTGTITLNSRLVATSTTTIDGPGAGVLTLTSPTDGVFLLNDFSGGDSSLEIEGLTLTGNAGNVPGSFGGAVAVGGRSAGLTIRNCTIAGSTAGNEAGAIGVKETPLNVVGSVIRGGVAGNGGGAIWARDSSVRVVDSQLTGNHSDTEGGAILMAESGDPGQSSLTITNSRLTGNTSLGDGGAIAVNQAEGPTAISRSTISGNTAGDDGGGLYLGYGEALTVESSTFADNAADSGGGLFVYAPSGTTSMANATVSGNGASAVGAGIYSFGYFDKPVRIANSTIASNEGAATGGGIFQFGYDGSGPGYVGPDEITLSSTIVANNEGVDIAQGQSTTGSIRLGHSLIGSTQPGARITQAPAGTNKLNTGSIGLGPLADNGGPTQTMLPAPGGPAIDAGAANGLATDQRGLARTVDQPLVPSGSGSDGTDIGAVELADSELSGASLEAKKKQKQKGKKVKVVVDVSAAESVTASAAGKVKLGKKQLALTKPSTELSAGESGKLQLKPKGKRATKKIARALAKGKKAKASVTVSFVDPAGNTGEESVEARLVD